MDPVTALRQIAYYKDRSRHDPKRVMAATPSIGEVILV